MADVFFLVFFVPAILVLLLSLDYGSSCTRTHVARGTRVKIRSWYTTRKEKSVGWRSCGNEAFLSLWDGGFFLPFAKGS